MRRLLLVLLLALAGSGCSAIDMVLPDKRAWTDDPYTEYPFLLKECAGNDLRIRLYLKGPPSEPDAVWDSDAFLVILPPGETGLPQFGYLDKRPTLPNGKKISRTFNEMFILENVLSSRNLAVLSVQQIFAQAKRDGMRKIFLIRPERDITFREYIEGTEQFFPRYLTLVEKCFYDLN